jgi:hypothetical protein
MEVQEQDPAVFQLLEDVGRTLEETRLYVVNEQQIRKKAENDLQCQKEELEQLRKFKQETESTLYNEIASLNATVLAKGSRIVELEQLLHDERENTKTAIQSAVDKAVLETVEHEIVTREVKIREAVELLRKVELKNENHKSNGSDNISKQDLMKKYKALELKCLQKDEQVETLQSQNINMKTKCSRFEQTIKEMKERDQENIKRTKTTSRKILKLEEQIVQLKEQLAGKKSMQLDLEQSKRELRLFKKNVLKKSKLAMESLKSEHAEAIKSVREEHRRQINRVNRKHKKAKEDQESAASNSVTANAPRKKSWSKEGEAVKSLQEKVNKSRLEKDFAKKNREKIAAASTLSESSTSSSTTSKLSPESDFMSQKNRLLATSMTNDGNQKGEKHRSKHSQVLMMVEEALEVGHQSMGRGTPNNNQRQKEEVNPVTVGSLSNFDDINNKAPSSIPLTNTTTSTTTTTASASSSSLQVNVDSPIPRDSINSEEEATTPDGFFDVDDNVHEHIDEHSISGGSGGDDIEEGDNSFVEKLSSNTSPLKNTKTKMKKKMKGGLKRLKSVFKKKTPTSPKNTPTSPRKSGGMDSSSPKKKKSGLLKGTKKKKKKKLSPGNEEEKHLRPTSSSFSSLDDKLAKLGL